MFKHSKCTYIQSKPKLLAKEMKQSSNYQSTIWLDCESETQSCMNNYEI